MMSISKFWTNLILLAGVFTSQSFAVTKVELQTVLPQIKTLASNPVLISAANAGNKTHETLDKTAILAQARQWSAGLKGKPSAILTEVNNSNLSSNLKSIQSQSHATYANLVVTDAKGLVIGQTYNAAHYAQAGQPLWRKINKEGTTAVYYGKTKSSENGSITDLGVPIVDNNQVIGALLAQVKIASSPKAVRESK